MGGSGVDHAYAGGAGGVVPLSWKVTLPRNMNLCYPNMAKSIKVTPKKSRGRPATGKDPHVTARMPPELIAQVEAWAAERDLGRSEAIRRLVERGLKAK